MGLSAKWRLPGSFMSGMLGIMGFRRVGFRVGFLTNGLVTSFPKKRLAFADPEGADLMSILKAWPPSGCCWLTAGGVLGAPEDHPMPQPPYP